MFKFITISFCLIFLLLGCSKKGKNEIVLTTEITDEKAVEQIYYEAVDALKKGDAYYASRRFKEVENLLPTTDWAAKSALMSAFALYSANFYEESIFNLKRYIKQYPADRNISYAEYLIGICYFEQILDEKKDLRPLKLAKKQFEYVEEKYPNTDYAIDVKFKLDLIRNQLAAKEMYIARHYIKSQKWIPAINRLKRVVEDYDKTIFVEEALHRLVEIYYKIGLNNEAKKIAAVLGYNYLSSEWYEKSYIVLNKDYKPKSFKDEKKDSLIRRKIKSLFE